MFIFNFLTVLKNFFFKKKETKEEIVYKEVVVFEDYTN